jgi:tetratricopeptide (TPR) repeat protein
MIAVRYGEKGTFRFSRFAPQMAIANWKSGIFSFRPRSHSPAGGAVQRAERFLSWVLLALFALTGAAYSQTAAQKPPALIRDTGVAEGKVDAETVVKKEYSPMRAAESLKVGDFYLKKKNYVAAIERYRDAIEYQPNLIAAYDALGRAYEKSGANDKALAVYRDVLQKFPESPKAPEFKSRCARLEKKK